MNAATERKEQKHCTVYISAYAAKKKEKTSKAARERGRLAT